MYLCNFLPLLLFFAFAYAKNSVAPNVDSDLSVPGGAVLLGSVDPNWAAMSPVSIGKTATAEDPVRRGTIAGLLIIERRQSCPPRTVLCEDNKCCSGTTGNCCLGGGCCPPESYCARGGCCPNGKICTGDGGSKRSCADPGFFLCPSEEFCCKVGYECRRDSNKSLMCGPPGGGTSQTTTQRPETSAAAVTTRTRTTTSTPPMSEVVIESISTSQTFAATLPNDPPAATPTATNIITYDASSASISWEGSTWETFDPTCLSGNTISTGKRTSSAGSFTFIFSGGTAVYLSMSCTGAAFAVSYAGVNTFLGMNLGGYTNTATGRGGCSNDTTSIVWSKTGLRPGDSRTVVVRVLDLPSNSEPHNARRARWALDFNQFVVEQSSTAPSQTSSLGSNGGGNGAVATRSSLAVLGAMVFSAFIFYY